MNKSILNTGVQDFIKNYNGSDILSVALKKSPFPNVSPRELAQQIASRRKCQKKLPTWFQTPGIYYPDKLNIEQASSELTAAYKAKLIGGESLGDLTGGMGVDSYHFSKRVRQVHYFEMNPELAEITAHNFTVLGAENITVAKADGISVLKQNEQIYNWIYLDPSRRAQHNRRVFLLEEGVPNILDVLPILFDKTAKVLLKTAPLLDIQKGMKDLTQVSEVHVVAVQNEVKELLWILDESPKVEPDIIAINITKKRTESLTFKLSEERMVESNFSRPLEFLYEPNAAILKAGAFKTIADRYGLKKLHVNSHLYTSSTLVDFPGRRFQITDMHPYAKKLPFDKANITTRNFPHSVDTLRKKHRIASGGDKYIFFTKTIDDQLVAIACVKC